jgi:hypothetical protein
MSRAMRTSMPLFFEDRELGGRAVVETHALATTPQRAHGDVHPLRAHLAKLTAPGAMETLVVARRGHAGVEAHAVDLPAPRYGDRVAERDDVKRRRFDAERVASRREEVLAVDEGDGTGHRGRSPHPGRKEITPLGPCGTASGEHTNEV